MINLKKIIMLMLINIFIVNNIYAESKFSNTKYHQDWISTTIVSDSNSPFKVIYTQNEDVLKFYKEGNELHMQLMINGVQGIPHSSDIIEVKSNLLIDDVLVETISGSSWMTENNYIIVDSTIVHKEDVIVKLKKGLKITIAMNKKAKLSFSLKGITEALKTIGY